MSKPLELTVYPKLERPRFGYDIDPYREQWRRERNLIESKRLADAELAAEFHKSTSDFMSANSLHMLFEDAETEEKLNDARDWMFAMERFATLPQYDEKETP